MKASIKFREEQTPLFQAKVPLNILGLPFQSGIVAGDSKELSLNLATFFDAGPSLKLSYRPNNSVNPISFVFKTGIGHFGSPISSPMTMATEFNLIGTQNPSFFVHFKPQFGDFTIKKSLSSDFVKSIKSKSNDAAVSTEEVEKITVLPSANLIGGLLSGVEARARTLLPVMSCAVVNFRWRLRFPPAAVVAVNENSTAGVSFRKFPILVMNKIGIEHVADDESEDCKGLTSPGSEKVAESCLAVKRQLEVIEAENGMLRKAMDDLKSEFASKLNGFGGKATEGM